MISANPEERVMQPRTAILLLVTAVVVLGALRGYIYTDMQKLGPERYDVPILLEHYHLTERDKELPEGVRPQEQSSLAGVGQAPPAARKGLGKLVPSTPVAQEMRLSRYQVPEGKAWVLVARYSPETELPLGKDFMHQDQDVAWITGDGQLESLAKAVEDKGKRVKRVTETVEKMKVLGNAYLKFTMEILLGIFFILTAFILTKYFFIRKQTEGV